MNVISIRIDTIFLFNLKREINFKRYQLTKQNEGLKQKKSIGVLQCNVAIFTTSSCITIRSILNNYRWLNLSSRTCCRFSIITSWPVYVSSRNSEHVGGFAFHISPNTEWHHGISLLTRLNTWHTVSFRGLSPIVTVEGFRVRCQHVKINVICRATYSENLAGLIWKFVCVCLVKSKETL